ncbi:hypothetical protein [uncultured Meiothermus sp.]|mgnify:CR=1 FL=1|uniref:hypothetical protein n=1 Tax=uncultured Meiothermus sp. TaxID=157471 RepID=UPI00261743DF|nr:hypothetical protein [uncultured Meiothermus sp.]
MALLARAQVSARLVYGDLLKDIGASRLLYYLIFMAKPKHPELVPVFLVCAEQPVLEMNQSNQLLPLTLRIS